MITQELLDYIKNRRQQGIPDNVIQDELVKSNWATEDVTAALHGADTGTPIPPPPAPLDTKTLIVILMLVLCYPVGIIFMWWWMKRWPLVAKITISSILLLLMILFMIPPFLTIFLASHRNRINQQVAPVVTDVPTAAPLKDNANFLFPTANASLCLNQSYPVGWEVPKNMQTVSIGIVLPGSDTPHPMAQMIPAASSQTAIGEKGSYSWIAGNALDNTTLKPGFGYRILLTAYTGAPINSRTYFWSSFFSLKDCSGNSTSAITPGVSPSSGGNSMCLLDNGCKGRTPGSGYRCDDSGAFSANGTYYCSCDATCNMVIH